MTFPVWVTSIPCLDMMMKGVITKAFVTYVFRKARAGIESDVLLGLKLNSLELELFFKFAFSNSVLPQEGHNSVSHGVGASQPSSCQMKSNEHGI